eukprot:XP_024453209.1 pentatricopeptide repeat-containing protein At1g09410, mitochondrial-like [Populus trichocarpa]
MGHSGFLFFCQMLQNGAEMDCRSFVLALKACEQFLRVLGGKSVHCEMDFLSMTDGYSKRNCWDETGSFVTRWIFDTMGVRDVFSWTRMVKGYAKSGELELARMSFNEMPERNVVSWSAMIAGTLVRVLSACVRLDCLEFVERNLSISDSADRRRVWQLEKNEIFTVKSAWDLIDDIWHPASNNFGYFSNMDENTTADNVVALNNVVVENSAATISLVASSAVVATISLAKPFLMICCVVVWVLLDTCLMEFPLEMDFVSMTDGYSKRNCWDETWKLFDSMSVEGNVEPEEVTMIAARSAGIFDTMGVRDVFSWTSMVNGYAKSGELELARMSFNEMPERNVVSWSAMIAGDDSYGCLGNRERSEGGCGRLEVSLVEEMRFNGGSGQGTTLEVKVCFSCVWVGVLGAGVDGVKEKEKEVRVNVVVRENGGCYVDGGPWVEN